jgi:hypothetical protein
VTLKGAAATPVPFVFGSVLMLPYKGGGQQAYAQRLKYKYVMQALQACYSLR